MDSPQLHVMVAVVSALDDPEYLARIRVRFPQLGDQDGGWARLLGVGAGPDRGLLWRPEVGDEVLVAFDGGDPNRPIVLGGLWNQQQPPPPDRGTPEETNLRVLRSRSGHQITLDDTEGYESVEICTGSHDVCIRMDDSSDEGHLTIEAYGGNITIEANGGNITLSATTGALTLQASSLRVQADDTLALEAGSRLNLRAPSVSVDADGELSLRAPSVSVDAPGVLKLAGDSQAELTTAGRLLLKGGRVEIN